MERRTRDTFPRRKRSLSWNRYDTKKRSISYGKKQDRMADQNQKKPQKKHFQVITKGKNFKNATYSSTVTVQKPKSNDIFNSERKKWSSLKTPPNAPLNSNDYLIKLYEDNLNKKVETLELSPNGFNDNFEFYPFGSMEEEFKNQITEKFMYKSEIEIEFSEYIFEE
eukprot:gene6878-11040_t